jgi:hypothetical protein
MIKVVFPLFSTTAAIGRKVDQTSLSIVPFRDVPDIDGYIPQIKIPGYLTPTLLCDIDHISESLIGWKENGSAPLENRYETLTLDFSNILWKRNMVAKFNINDFFSRVEHWPCHVNDSDAKPDRKTFLSCSIFDFLFQS